jgi:hypothetical protein
VSVAAGDDGSTVPGVVPVASWAATTWALGAPADLQLVAAGPAPLEDALLLLRELSRQWGAHGELAAIGTAPPLHRVRVSGETVLLLSLTGSDGVAVDVADQLAWRTGRARLPDPDARRALAVDLLVAELLDAGAAGALVGVGSAWRASGPRLGGAAWRIPCGSTGVDLADGALVVRTSSARSGSTLAARAPYAWQAWRALGRTAGAGQRPRRPPA